MSIVIILYQMSQLLFTSVRLNKGSCLREHSLRSDALFLPLCVITLLIWAKCSFSYSSEEHGCEPVNIWYDKKKCSPRNTLEFMKCLLLGQEDFFFLLLYNK